MCTTTAQSKSSFEVRLAQAGDYDAIRHLLDSAFGRKNEGKLVDWLRADGLVIAELVAIDTATGAVAGYLLGSRITIETTSKETIPAVAAGPFAVAKQYSSTDVSRLLIAEGLRIAKESGENILIGLGRSGYKWFGFKAELAASLHCRFSRAPDADGQLLGFEIAPNSLSGVEGKIIYPAPWKLV